MKSIKTFYSQREKQLHENQILIQARPAITRSLADTVVIKDENIFLLPDEDGNVLPGKYHGLALYYHDCSFLNGYELRIANTTPKWRFATKERYSALAASAL